jgi:predicted metalloprotease with PDZ domain
MRVAVVVAAFFLTALVSSSHAQGRAVVQYELRPVVEAGLLVAVDIRMQFQGEPDGETVLQLPGSWGGEDELWRALSDIEVRGATITGGESPAFLVLRHAPRARIDLRYQVRQEYAGAPDVARDDNYRVIVQPGYFNILGNAAFVVPRDDEGYSARFRIRGLPRGWSFASDLEHRRDLSIEDVLESVSVGGDFEIFSGAGGFRLAIRGDDWAFDKQALADEIVRIVDSERAFWGDGDEPYLVTMLPLISPDPNWQSLNGTGRSDAFAFFSTPNALAETLTRISAHEAMHTWIPRRIGLMPVEAEASAYWISEGFTDFYTYRLLVRGGFWAPEDFAAAFNEMLTQYANSTARAAPNARIAESFWSDRDVQRLPYQRGMLFALLQDSRLRQASGGANDLDDVVLAMRRAFGDGSDPQPIVQAFASAMAQNGVAVEGDIARYIESGEFLLLPRDFFSPCGDMETTTAPPFHRGFDVEATLANDNVITGVVVNSPAYNAGMRDGMRLVRREGGEIGNSAAEIAYRVAVDREERTLRYLPQGAGPPVTRQRLVLADHWSEGARAACTNLLAGA